MSVARPLPFASRSPDACARADTAFRVSATLIAGYLALTTWPVWRHAQSSQELAPLLAHLFALAYVVAVLRVRRLPRALLDWLTLTVGPFMYVELRWIIQGLGRPHRDALLVSWEQTLFPSNPSATLALAWGSRPLSEALHLAYASYYLLVYLPPLLLYLRGRRVAFAATMLALTLVYGACFVVYALFPVDGPRFLVGPAAAPDGPVRAMVLSLLEHGSSRGTAFPSSHVAASVVASLSALRFERRLGVLVACVTACLTVSTVYGGFHYAIDAVAGVALGLVAWAIATSTDGIWARNS